MCGIAGLWHLNGREAFASDLIAMGNAIRHRGPDDAGQWIEGEVGLAHQRLSILDLSDAGHQPMSSPCGRFVVTYNGEIYNYESLKNAIERETGYQFRSTCDTEILPIGFRTWGNALFDKLEGMFALAIWDRQDKTLTLARDGIGIKPLYVLEQNDTLYFASEIKSFLALPEISKQIDPHSLLTLLANGYVSPNASILKNAWQVDPGTFITINQDRRAVSRYWAPRRKADIHNMDEACQAVEETLSTVVGDMMRSDVRIGILQSGGVDSSLISYSARDNDVPLFTAKFAQKTFDESPQASLVAHDTGLEHHIVPMNDQVSAQDIVLGMADAYEGQLSDSSGFAFSTLCHTIKQHVTVALAGEGGDEFFAGYPTYRASRLGRLARSFLPAGIWETVGRQSMSHAAKRNTRIPLAEKFGRFALGLAHSKESMHAQWRRYLFAHQQDALVGTELKAIIHGSGAFDPLDAYAQTIHEADGQTLLDKWLVGDQSYYLPADMLAKTDRISMAHSLEIRVPFLDRRMMELSGRIDASLMTPLFGKDKKVLRQTLARMGGPEELVKFAKKGFNVPIAILLREELRELCTHLFERNPDLFAPHLDPDGIRQMWHEHRDCRQSHHYVLWTLLVLGVWMERAGLNG